MLLRLLRGAWYAHLRRIDLMFLWPSCKKAAAEAGLEIDPHAKAAFAQHAFHDPPWLWLGVEAIHRRIDALR